MQRRSLRVTAVALVGLCLAVPAAPTWAAVGAASATPAMTVLAQPKQISVLYSLSAKDATLTPTSKSGTFTLTLSGVDGRTVWFADRPDRDAGSMPTSAFVKNWKSAGFAAVPPNAAVVLHAPVTIGNRQVDTCVVELSHPKRSGATLSFRAKVLDEESASSLSGHLSAHGDRHDGASVSASGQTRLGGVSIFIDDASVFVSAALADPEATGGS